MKENTTDTQPLFVTFFENEFAKTLTTDTMHVWDLRDKILTTTASAKDKLPWLKLALFGKKRTAKGSLRHNANVISISGIEADYDAEQFTFDWALNIIKRSRLAALVYTSPSNRPDKPRWRILCPTSRELMPNRRAKLVNRLVNLCGDIFAPESFVLSQSYFFGRVSGNNAHRCEYYNGDFIDQRPDLDVGAIVKRRPVTKRRKRAANNADGSIDRDIIVAALEVVPSDKYWPWLEIGAALHHVFGDAGFELFDRWSAKSRKYNARQCAFKWRECAKFTQYTGATILFYADQASPGWRSIFQAKLLAELSFFRKCQHEK